MEIGKKLKMHEYSLNDTRKCCRKKSMYQGRQFQTGKMKILPRHYQCNRVEQPIFYKSWRIAKGWWKNDWTFRRKYKCCKKQPKNDMGNYCKYHCRSIADNIKYVYTR